MTVADNKTAGSQKIWHILRTIDQRAMALLKSGAPWKDGALDFELPLGGLSPPEVRLITKLALGLACADHQDKWTQGRSIEIVPAPKRSA
jgi:hypothetical protein